MSHFDPERAIFGVLAAEVNRNPEETVFSYVNQATRNQFGEGLKGERVLDLLGKILKNSDLASKYFRNLLLQGSITLEGELNERCVQYHSSFDAQKGHLQAAIMDTTESRRNEEGFKYTAEALARAAEVMDEDMGNHIVRMNKYAGRLSELMELDEEFTKNIYIVAQLHDVGKLYIDRNLLRKPARLTQEEYAVFKNHPIYGAKIIGEHPQLVIARQIALGHHEKWDGSGYPAGLSGEDIPLPARIVSVVDVFDALISKRSYKESYSYDKAYKIMSEGDERTDPQNHFDPKALKPFLHNYEDFVRIHFSYKNSFIH